jgi:nitroreductase
MIIEHEIDTKHPKIAEANHPINDLFRQRWSPRQFSDEPVTRDEMKTLLEAARWAASSYNKQPWRFIYAFQGSRSYERIFSCLAEFNQQWVKNAPVLMLTAFREKTEDGKDNFHGHHDLGQAVANMSIQATDMGIAIHQMAGLDWKKAQDIFDVPEDFHISTAIAIGRFGGNVDELPEDLQKSERQERERMPIEDFAKEGGWPEA